MVFLAFGYEGHFGQFGNISTNKNVMCITWANFFKNPTTQTNVVCLLNGLVVTLKGMQSIMNMQKL